MRAHLVLFSSFRSAALAWALIETCVASTQDVSYKRESSRVYDEGRVVEAKLFSPSTLLEQFRAFATAECSGRKLARLIVAPTQVELAKAINVSFVLDDMTSAAIEKFVLANPALLGQDVGRLNVAQVLCVGENATAMIRSGDRVEQHQISGPADSRKWSVRGTEVTFVGFSVHAGAREWISAFLRTLVLPDPETAAAIRDDLERRTGIRTYLILRTDPFFWDMDGPKFDAFEVPVPRISSKEFLTRPFVSCPPSDNQKPCRVETFH